jgi:hypothetical protein
MFGTEPTFDFPFTILKAAMHPAQAAVHRKSVRTGVED